MFEKEKYSTYARFCGFLLEKVLGWTAATPPAQAKKCIILGVPHTSLWDFVVSYLYYKSLDMETHVMVKKWLFKWPLSFFLRKMGAIPVDDKSRAALVRSCITEMGKHEVFHLAIAPEGTRKPVKKWAKGYHLIAKAVGCPVFLCYFDWATKRVGVGPELVLTDDANADTARMQQMYEDMHLGAKHPEKYITK